MMHRVLVTGATGLIGRHLLPSLSQSGYSVHALANRRKVPDELRPLATWHSADLAQPHEIDAVLHASAPSLLLHLAWPTVTGNLGSDVHREFLSASQHLIASFYRQGGTRAVVAGTCFEYDWSDGICVEDRTPVRPSTVYGQCKEALRAFTRETALAHGASWGWGRIFFVYGPQQDPTRFVPAIIQGLLAGQSVPCTTGLQVRDYLHAHDVASGLLRLLESGYRGECNIGSGEALTLRDIATEIARHLGGEGLIHFGAKPTPSGEPPVILADVTRLSGELHWKPRFSLSTGIADTIAAFRGSDRVLLAS